MKLKNNFTRIALASVFCAWAFHVLQAAEPVTSTAVTPGVWCTSFETALAYAEKNHLPIMAFWGEGGCGFCKTLMNQGIDTAKFKEWQSKRKPILIWYHGPNKTTPYKEWIRNPASGEWPYVKIYWKKADGTKVEAYFAGRDGKMAVKGGDKTASIVSAVSKWVSLSTPGQISGGKANLNEQLIASFEKYCSSWTPENPYSGGYFTVTNRPNSRLEAVVGKTSFVNIPLFRTATAAAVNKLKIGSAEPVTLSWASGETAKMYKYVVPSTAKAGSSVALKLLDADGKTLKSTSAVNFVAEPKTTAVNPKWLGETFDHGEWTMDLDAALKKAKENGSFTLALSTGALWCPFCKSFEETVLNADRFKKWAVENKVNLVALDNPKRSADDRKDASGVLTAVGSKANGAPPTLLRYAEDGNGVSGAAYLSRKMIAVGTASDKTTAEGVLQRNHDLLYKGGALCAPEEWRTSYPLFILVKPDGTAAGRILPAYDYSQAKWGVSLEETLARLNELLKLAASDETASKPSTTKSVLSVEESVKGSLQVNANTVFYRLSNVPVGKVAFASNDKQLTLTVYETSSTLANAKKLAQGNGSVTADFGTAAGKFLSVSFYQDGLEPYGGNTTRSFEVSSVVTLSPKETLGTFTTKSGKVKMNVVSGKLYKLSGFSSYSDFEKRGDCYLSKNSGVIDLSAPKGGTVTYRIWNPGKISFVKTSARKMESDKTCVVEVSRSGGGSGSAEVSVSVDAGTLKSARVTVSPAKVSWKDGEVSVKKITCTIRQDSAFNPDEKFTVTLTPAAGSAVPVDVGTFALTVSDTDDPVLSASSLTYRFYKGIEVEYSYPVQNVKSDGRVTIVKDGKLPAGLKVKYDHASKTLRLYGKPSRAMVSVFSLSLRERRPEGYAQGQPTTFNVTVADPKALKPGEKGYNAILASGKSAQTVIPLYTQVDGQRLLAATVDLKLSSTGRFTAKYVGAGNEKQSFSGNISELTDGGAAKAVLAKRAAELSVTIDAKGGLDVAVSGVEDLLGGANALKGAGRFIAASGFADYAGYYTVTLPVEIGEEKDVLSTGTGYLTISATASSFKRSGAVSVKYYLPNGRTGTVKSYLIPDAFKDDVGDWALLPLMKTDAADNSLGLTLRIRKNAAKTYERNPQVVLIEKETVGYWLCGEEFTPLNVYGGYYDSKMDLFECCNDSYATSEFSVVISDDRLAKSERRGAIVAVPQATAVVSADGKLTVENAGDLKATLKVTTRTGLVTGKFPVLFEDGSRVSATFKGVLLPRWHDCNCAEADYPIIERPFVSGSAVFTDKVGGKSTKRGFSVDLHPVD